MDEKSILVNLGDEKAKEISEVIGSKTCNKILGYLSEHEGTVSDISGALKIPLNTTDYNVKKLVKSGLIEKASHFWSVKGKRMPTYRVSNKKIIISPKKSIGKIFAWTLGLTGLMALTIREFFGNKMIGYRDIDPDLAFEAAPKVADAVVDAVQTTAGAVPELANGAMDIAYVTSNTGF